MKRSLRAAAAALTLLALPLAGCAVNSVAPAGAYKMVKDYSVTLPDAWSDISNMMLNRPPNVRLLSHDGPLLDRLYLTDGLLAGQVMVKAASKEKPTPTYRAGMAPTEMVEFVADSVAALDYQRVATDALRPAKFGEADAIRFDITAKTSEGLDISGTALVSDRGGKLYVILYLAPTEHYYGAYLASVESIMGSAQPAG